MKKLLYILLCLGHMMLAQPINPVIPKNDPSFDLVFSDEFDSTALRQENWMKNYPWGHPVNSNKIPSWYYTVTPGITGSGWCPDLAPPNDNIQGLEMHYDSTRNISFSGDTCLLIARKENRNLPIWTYPSNCSSPVCAGYGCLPPNYTNCFKVVDVPFKYSNANLISKFKFKYGYFEARFKEPVRVLAPYQAFTATFWMLDFADNASDLMQYSELDWMENNARNDRYNSTIHWRTKFMSDSDADIIINQESMPNNQWHTVGGYWYPGGIDFYKDDVYTGSWRNDTAALLRPMYMIVGVGSPADNYCAPIDSVNTPFPFNFKIDYVKVWQQNSSGCDTTKTVCNKTLATHPPDKVYSSITESGTGCTVNLNNGSRQILGKDFTQLQEGFEVGNNGTILMETRPCYTSDFFRYQGKGTPNPPIILTNQMIRDLYSK